jgi:DNA-binding NarL/FixJ family response regulator
VLAGCARAAAFAQSTHNDPFRLAVIALMSTVFIARRDALSVSQAQARLQTSRDWRVLGASASLFAARAELPRTNPEALLIDLRLEDGAALSLVRDLRQRRQERPKVMLLAADAADPLLFSTLTAGADAYLLEADLPVAASALQRMLAGEATMAAPVAAQTLRFFNEPLKAPSTGSAADDRRLDWTTHGANPMKLSPGECRLVRLLAQGMLAGEVAARMALSFEAVGRRVGNLYRKLSWDVRSGSLALQAA